ncbi:MAG TPA: zinc-binding dehydrogenase [Chloroflexota bacterium]|nr:zinc-binding dehydrogenase [Chloroflexota bacterium]
MKAVVKTAPGDGNVSLEDIPEPTPPPGHVLISVQAAGICGTDIHIYHDEFRSVPPVVLGHEVSGTIAAVGEGVTSVQVGMRVTTETYFSTCGACRFCREGRVNLCPDRRSIGSAVNGGFTELLVVPAANVHELPASLGFREGALVEPLACVIHGLLDGPRLQPADLAVIAGPGAIGLLALQVLKAAGVWVIVLGTSTDAHRLELAKSLGAAATLTVDREDGRTAIHELSDGLGADLVVECSGAGPAAQNLLEVVRRGGQYAQIGLFGKPVAWDLDQICYKELTVTGSNASVPSAWTRALDLLDTGMVRLDPLISGVYPLQDWEEAFRTVENRAALKILLSPGVA